MFQSVTARAAIMGALMVAALGATAPAAAQTAAVEPPPPKIAVAPAPKIAVAPRPPPPGPQLRSDFQLFYALGFTMVGVGGAGAIAGAVTGALALGINKKLEETCGLDDPCEDKLPGENDRRSALTGATIGLLIVGPALFIGGITVLVWNATTAYETPVSVQVGPTSASMSVRF